MRARGAATLQVPATMIGLTPTTTLNRMVTQNETRARELKAKLKPPTPDHSRPRRLLVRPAEGVRRNAIGVHLPPREESRTVPIVVHGPTVAPGVGIGAIGGMGKSLNVSPRERLVHAPPTLRMVTAPANRGTISGTAMTKPGTSISGIGGPAKSVVGINGSTIKPRY